MVISVNDHQVESFIDYLHRDPRVLADISEQLNKNAALLESADNIPGIGDSEPFMFPKRVKSGLFSTAT